MYGRSYQWLIMGTTRKEWWNASDTECTVEELKMALETAITTDLLPLSLVFLTSYYNRKLTITISLSFAEPQEI